MGNKPKWNEALSEAMRGQLGTTREVFTNANGSNVVLEKYGDKWHRDHSEGSPDVDAEEEEEPEGEGEGEGGGGDTQPPTKPGGDFIPAPPGGSPPPAPGTGHGGDKKPKKTVDKGPKFGGKTNAKNEKIKNVYEEMKAQIDEQLNHYYKTGKFTIDPTQMMNQVFSKIMSKYGYKSIFNNWFKNAAEKRTWVKKAWET